MKHIKTFRKYSLNEQNSEIDLPKYLYHLTSYENYKKIKNEGLTPNKTKQGYGEGIYLTDEIHVAEEYSAFFETGDELTLLQISTQHLDINKFGSDDYELSDFLRNPWKDDERIEEYDKWSEVPWELSLEWVHQIKYYGVIPPKYIKMIKKWTY